MLRLLRDWKSMEAPSVRGPRKFRDQCVTPNLVGHPTIGIDLSRESFENADELAVRFDLIDLHQTRGTGYVGMQYDCKLATERV